MIDVLKMLKYFGKNHLRLILRYIINVRDAGAWELFLLAQAEVDRDRCITAPHVLQGSSRLTHQVMRSVEGFSTVRTHPPTNSLGTACTSILQAMVLVARGYCRRGEMYVTLAEEPTAWEVVPAKWRLVHRRTSPVPPANAK